MAAAAATGEGVLPSPLSDFWKAGDVEELNALLAEGRGHPTPAPPPVAAARDAATSASPVLIVEVPATAAATAAAAAGEGALPSLLSESWEAGDLEELDALFADETERN